MVEYRMAAYRHGVMCDLAKRKLRNAAALCFERMVREKVASLAKLDCKDGVSAQLASQGARHDACQRLIVEFEDYKFTFRKVEL